MSSSDQSYFCTVLSLLYRLWILQRSDAFGIKLQLRKNLRLHFQNFSYNDNYINVRDLSLYAHWITKVIVSRMEAYIPHTLPISHAEKHWFNHVCSRTIKDREAACKMYPNLKFHTIHLYISAENRAKAALRKCKNLLSQILQYF